MDASTITAIAALIVAIIAFLVACAQATQQYFITGQNIRLCDSVVFADMPGQGRRIWETRQWRFRVVYQIPVISLPSSFWPRTSSVRFAERRWGLPDLSGRGVAGEFGGIGDANGFEVVGGAKMGGGGVEIRQPFIAESEEEFSGDDEGPKSKAVGPRTGEAAWVSFCRAIHYSCWQDVRYDLVERDVDRCPSDLPSVPMPLSMRDVVVMALATGMNCTDASFAGRTISMQGAAGILTTSQHPVLGPLIHFTPGDTRLLHGIVSSGIIPLHWLYRTWDACPVSNRHFTLSQRRHVEKTAGIWIHRIRSSTATTRNSLAAQTPGTKKENRNKSGERKKIVVDDKLDDPPSAGIFIQPPLSQRGGFHDGRWSLRVHDPRSQMTIISPPASKRPTRSRARKSRRESSHGATGFYENVLPEPKLPEEDPRPQPTKKPYQATVEDMDPDESEPQQQDSSSKHKSRSHNMTVTSSHGGIHSRIKPIGKMADPQETLRREIVQKQMERNAKAAKVADDEVMVDEINQSGRTTKAESERLLLEWGVKQTKPLTEEELKAIEREKERQKQRKAREQRDEERQKRNEENYNVDYAYGRVNWFWLSQTDIVPGYWATPWRNFQALTPDVCSGAEIIILNALSGFTDSNSLRYVDHWKGLDEPAMNWVLHGRPTFPGYALNARGGVVCSGDYPAVKVDVFKDMIPALELYKSYDYQIRRDRRMTTRSCQKELLELMRLDAWLSLCGRTDEIQHGRNDLIKQTPAMVQLVLGEFEYDFMQLDRSDHEGGMQVNQALAANVMDFLLDEELSGAEQLYVLVALLRTVKVGLGVVEGPDTGLLEGILREDIQVHMV